MEETRKVLTIGNHKRPVIRRPGASSSLSRNYSRRCSSTATRSSTLRPLPSSEEKPPSTQQCRSHQSCPASPKKQQEMSTDCKKLHDQLIQSKDVKSATDEELRCLIPYLRDYITELSLAERYDEACNESELAELAKNELQMRKEPLPPNTDALDAISEQKKAIIAEYEEKINELKNRLNTKEQKVIEQQKQETESFEKTWSVDMPRKYRKPSQRLLELKEKEHFLALSNDFEGAKKLHAEAETLSERETVEAQHILIKNYRHAKNNMNSQHQRVLENLNSIRERKIVMLEQQRDMRLKELDNREVVLQMKAKENGTKERSDPRNIKASYGACRRRVKPDNENLLGQLVPPNDPSFIEEEKKQQAERRKRQSEFQKKNAEDLLGEEPVSPSKTASKQTARNEEEEKNEDSLKDTLKDKAEDINEEIHSEEKSENEEQISTKEEENKVLQADKVNDSSEKDNEEENKVLEADKVNDSSEKDNEGEKEEDKDCSIKNIIEDTLDGQAQ